MQKNYQLIFIKPWAKNIQIFVKIQNCKFNTWVKSSQKKPSKKYSTFQSWRLEIKREMEIMLNGREESLYSALTFHQIQGQWVNKLSRKMCKFQPRLYTHHKPPPGTKAQSGHLSEIINKEGDLQGYLTLVTDAKYSSTSWRKRSRWRPDILYKWSGFWNGNNHTIKIIRVI